MIRIGICDDAVKARDALRFELEKVIGDKAEIVYEFSSGERVVSWFSKYPGEIDLLFLDVEMEQLNGMDTAEKIRKFNKELIIVFVTGYSDYVFDGYKVGALDYIMKPAAKDKLKLLMDRVYDMTLRSSNEFYIIKNTEGTYRLPLSEIGYFYSEKRKTVAVTELREYEFYEKLAVVEVQLKESFIRIHQRYLVNPKAVSHIGTTFVVINGVHLPMSRALKETDTLALTKTMVGGNL